MARSSNPVAVRYRHGDWFGVVRQGTVVLLGPDTPATLVDSVWNVLASAPEAHEVLHEVTDAFGVSLSRIPPFGIIDAKDGLRVFLRGELELSVQSGTDTEQLSGRDVTTWTERRLASVDAYSLKVGSNTTTAGKLPLLEGVVRLAALDVVFTEAAGTAVAAPPVRVSDETVLDYPDTDLGLTIAPHLAPNGQEEERPAEAAPADVDSSAEEAPEDSTDTPVHTSTTDPLLPTLETTTNYDHLWDKTVMRNIEDAAVRIVDDSDEHDVPAAPAPKSVDTPEPTTTEGEKAREGASDVVSSPASPEPEPAPAPLGVPALIDSVPWLRGSPPAQAPEVRDEVPSLAAPPAQPSPAPSPAETDPDHDGQTIMKSSVAGDLPSASGPPSPSPRTGNGPSVLARVCPQGHANPPTYPQCAACGSALSGDAVQVPRPRLGRMRLSTGELLDLDQSLIIGRQPSVSRVQGGTMPRLVQVDSPGGDISRSHVEVRLEGWHVMLCDLKATNGTVLIREGQAPRRLAQNEMAILLDGDIAELGDNISLRFEEIL